MMIDISKHQEFIELINDISALNKELARLEKRTDIDVLDNMIMSWANELDSAREKHITRIEALKNDTKYEKTATLEKKHVRDIDKQLAKLSKLYSLLPAKINNYAEENECHIDSWTDFLQKMGYDIAGNYKGEDSPLDLRKSITRAFNNRDIDIFYSLVEKYLQLVRMKRDVKTSKELSRKLWAGYIRTISDEESKIRNIL